MKTFGNVSFLEFFGNNFIKLIRICPPLQRCWNIKYRALMHALTMGSKSEMELGNQLLDE